MAKIIKRIIYIVVTLALLISAKTYASELILESPDSISTGETIEYTLKGTLTEKINSVKVRYVIPKGVQMQDFTTVGDWKLIQGGTSDETGLILRLNGADATSKDENKTGEIEFGKFIFEVPSSYDKKNIMLELYELDATNTDCAVVEFDSEKTSRTVEIANYSGEEEGDNKEEDDNPPLGGDDEGEDDTPNPPSEEDNKPSTPSVDEDKNNDSEGNFGTQLGDGNKDNSDNSYGSGISDSNTEDSSNISNNKDSTAIKSPMGQYGDKSMAIIIVIISITVGIALYFKCKKFRNIK